MPAFSIEGIQELQDENIRIIAALKPGTALGRMLQLVIADLHRYAASITHVNTGTLRASHRMALYDTYAEVSIGPGSVNPRTHQRAAVYGVFENDRGGSHAFYDRTVAEEGQTALDRAQQYLETHP